MDQQTLVYLVWLIPLLPLTAFFTIMLFTRGHDRLSHTIAIGAMMISFVLAQIVFWNVVNRADRTKPRSPVAATEAPAATAELLLPKAHTAAEANTAIRPTSNRPFRGCRRGLNTLNMGVLVDPLTAVMLFMVPLACLMIFIYSVGYSNFNKKHDAARSTRFPAAQGPRADVRALLCLPLVVCGRDVDVGGRR